MGGRLALLLLPAVLAPAAPPAAQSGIAPFRIPPLEWASTRLGSSSLDERVAAQRILARLGPEAHPFLLQALREEDWRLREGALTAFAWGRGRPPAKALAPLADDPAWSVRRALALVWGWHGLGRALLRRLVEDPFQDVRAAAVTALAAQPGLPDPAVEKAFTDPAEVVRRAAYDALVSGRGQLRLSRLPGEAGSRPRRRVLRALTQRPLAAQVPLLRDFAHREGGPLGERLLALQVLRPLGATGPGDAALVLAGLGDSRPEVRGVAVGAGRFLAPAELEPLLLPGFHLPRREQFQAFLALLAGREQALAAPLAAALREFHRSGRWGRRALAWFLLQCGMADSVAGKALVARYDRERGMRLGEVIDRAARGGSPGLAEWLLARAREEGEGELRSRIVDRLVRFADREEVRRFLLAELESFSFRARCNVVKSIIRVCRKESPERLLAPLAAGGLTDYEKRAYLQALGAFPRRGSFLGLLRGIVAGGEEARLVGVALRLLVAGGPPGKEDRELLERTFRRPELSYAVRRKCLEALARAGEWRRLEAICHDLAGREALKFRRDLAVFIRRHRLREGLPLVAGWAEAAAGSELALHAHLCLAALGRKESFGSLLGLEAAMGAGEAARVVELFRRAPAALAERLFRRWTAPTRPDYFRREACLLAAVRPELPLRRELERLGVEDPAAETRGAALRALVARGEEELVRRRLPRLLAAETGSLEEAVLMEVLAGIRESGATWAAPFFWRALLARHLADPVGETARDRRSAARRQRGVLEEARLLGEQLYSLPDQVVAASFDRFIVPWRNRPGGMLLGKDLVAVLLQGALGPLRGEPKPLTAERIARYSLELRPPGGLDDLAARIFLADRLEREKRWEQAAGLYRRVLLAFHLGRVSSRGLEVVIGRAQPEAGRFPLLRLLARPFLLEARAALAAGKEEAAEKLLERALAEGEADSTVRRAVAEIRRRLEARGR